MTRYSMVESLQCDGVVHPISTFHRNSENKGCFHATCVKDFLNFEIGGEDVRGIRSIVLIPPSLK
jgi:hypothetical protein